MSSWIKLGAIAGLSSVILVMLLGQSRIFGRWPMTVYCHRREPRASTFLHSMDYLNSNRDRVAIVSALFTVREAVALFHRHLLAL